MNTYLISWTQGKERKKVVIKAPEAQHALMEWMHRKKPGEERRVATIEPLNMEPICPEEES